LNAFATTSSWKKGTVGLSLAVLATASPPPSSERRRLAVNLFDERDSARTPNMKHVAASELNQS